MKYVHLVTILQKICLLRMQTLKKKFLTIFNNVNFQLETERERERERDCRNGTCDMKITRAILS
jgi:hypothetical protein